MTADRATPPAREVSLFNIANGLTTLRLILVPIFAVLLLKEDGKDIGWRIGAAVVFALAVITDKYDGDIARSRGLVTDFGKMADPIADKALMGTALVGLSVLAELPWWVTVVILVREVGVTLLRFWVIRYGVIPASRGGKAKTFAQSLAIWMYVLPLSEFFASLRWWFMGIAVILTVATGIDYIFRAARLRRTRNLSEPLTPLDTTESDLSAAAYSSKTLDEFADDDAAPKGDDRSGGRISTVSDPAYAAAQLVIETYARAGQTIGTAESLTGGLLCAALTSVPGASSVVRGGLIVYATDLKVRLVGVPSDELAHHGPVSESTALHLAAGAARRTGADWGIATTGVAGPDKQDDKDVGTVWIGLQAPGVRPQARKHHFVGDRDQIRRQTVLSALEWLASQIDRDPRERN